MSAPPLTTGDALADEWAARVYRLIRDNNGVVERCLERTEEDFDLLPEAARAELRELTVELLPDLLPRPSLVA